MSIESAVYKLLTTNGAISAVVSTRVYPLEIPEMTTRPAIAYTTISTGTNPDFDSPSGLDAVSVQIDAIADTYAAVLDLKSKIRSAFEAFSGTVGGAFIQMIECTNDRDMDAPVPLDPKIYHRLLEFTLYYEPPTA